MEVKSVPNKTIGVLALQGSFAEHIAMLAQLGAKAVPVRSLTDTKNLDGLIIPGGESTTMIKLLKSTGLDQWLKNFASHSRSIRDQFAINSRSIRKPPIYGTCAGMIVLANLGLIDITLDRNAYGPQLYSFESNIELKLFSVSPVESGTHRSPRTRFQFPGVFIRAPRVKTVGPKVRTLAYHGKDAVLLEQNNVLVGSFHPELTEDSKIHRYFLSLC